MKPILPRLNTLLRPDSSDIWIIVAYSVAIGLLTLALPVASQSLINTVAFGTVLQPIIVLSILLFAALIAASALQACRHWLVEMLQRRLFVRIAGNSGHRLLHAQSSFFDNVHGPELVNRFLDAAIVQKSVAVILIDGLTITMQTTVGLLLLAVYHPLLLLFDAVLFVFILTILFGLGRGAVRSSVAESEAKYEVLAWLEELARNRSAFRSAAGRSFGWGRTDALAQHYIQKRTAHFRIEFRQLLGSLCLQAFAISALLGFGGYLVTQGQLTLGQLVAGELIVSTIVYGFTKLSKSLESYYDLSAAVDEIGYLDDLPLEKELGQHELTIGSSASIRLVSVNYGYRGGQNTLSNVDLHVEAGQRVAIHGELGAGKSTLLDIMSSLRAPDAGHLEIDGCDFRDLKLDRLRTQVALVRRPEIFAGTLLENLTLGADQESSRVRTVLEQVGLQAVVSSLPDALQTQIATGGAPLTRTQSLRLMIARSLLLKPGVLLLDGVLDSLEGLQNNDPLLELLFGRDAPWTLVMTSNKAEILRRCGQIYLLENGRLRTSPFAQDNKQESAS